MKVKFATLLMMASTFFATAGFAQTKIIQADVPFSFHVGDKTLAAGNYTVSMLTENTLAIRSTEGKLSELALISTKEGLPFQNDSKLVFALVDGDHFLKEVRDGSKNIGIQLPVSRTIREVARKRVDGLTEYQGSK